MRFRTLALAATLVSALARSQSFTPVREIKNLSPGAIDKLHTLETLNALPPGDWRFHAGDIPHGESPTLDDSAWQVVSAPTGRKYVKAPKDAVWYRRTIEVPKTLNGYDITGARIWFQFRADANGPMPEIIYFNGRRVALGDDLEPVILFEPAKPGDKILVAVKLLHTVDDKTFTGVGLRIEPTDAMHRPSPEDVRQQAITAANLLPALPTPRRDLLPTVESAVNAIDFDALKAADQSKFDASLIAAQKLLSTLHVPLSEANVTLAGNAHIDAAWLWPKSETVDVVRRTFTTALQLMDEYPDYTYTQSAAAYNEWMAEKYPDLHKQIQQRVKEGRWELVGGMWVEPDLNIPDGESLVRQLLIGQRYFQKEFGVTTRIGWNPDSFGYNWQLPQIYKRSGLDYFVTQKMHWNDTNQLPFRLFWWESPDGSKVLTYFPTDYVHDNVNPTRISADFAESAARNPGTADHLDLYGIGDHGGGPTRNMLDQADHWIAGSKSGEAVPSEHYGSAQSFFSTIEKKLNPVSPLWNYDSIAKGYTPPPAGPNGELGLPTWNSELYFEYHRGVFTSQAQHKRYNRTTETATLDAEKLASLAWLQGAIYPATDFTESWKNITFNQFHDLAAGSGIAVIYKDAAREYEEVLNSDTKLNGESREELTAHIDTGSSSGTTPVLVWNTLPWRRTQILELDVELPEHADAVRISGSVGTSTAAQILSQDRATNRYKLLVLAANVPSMGYTVLGAGKAKDSSPGFRSDLTLQQTSSSITLENAALEVVVDKSNGCITKVASSRIIQMSSFWLAPNSCGNQLQAFTDTPKNYDAWNVDPGTLDKAPAIIDKIDSIAVIADGPLRKTVRVTRSWGKSHFVQDISLDSFADHIDVANDIDWHESHILLKAAFPLAATSSKATYEIPYGSIERSTTRDNTFSKAQFEVPALRWADLGDDKQGVSILNDSKYGYDALGNTLRLTLLRSPTWPDPDADQGRQRFTYSIYPHVGSWKDAATVHRAYELNTPLRAEQTFSHTGSLPATHSFASVENPNVILTAMKKAEDADALIFRMYEATGKATSVKLHIPPGASYATETNLMEKVEGPHLSLSADTVTVDIKPFQILTVEAVYPLAHKK